MLSERRVHAAGSPQLHYSSLPQQSPACHMPRAHVPRRHLKGVQRPPRGQGRWRASCNQYGGYLYLPTHLPSSITLSTMGPRPPHSNATCSPQAREVILLECHCPVLLAATTTTSHCHAGAQSWDTDETGKGREWQGLTWH